MDQIRWVDSHCHPHLIIDEEDGDLVVLKEAVDSGTRMMCVSVEMSDYEKLAEYKKLYPDHVKISLGQHPLHEQAHNVKPIDWKEFERLVASDKNILAIGETGFDFQGGIKNAMEEQKHAFHTQVDIACKYDLPIILHTRDVGNGEIEQITREEIIKAKKAHENLVGVMHCFTSSLKLAEFAIENGWYVSFSGIVTFKNANSLREVALNLFKMGFLDRLLIETDAPYLAPQAVRGKTNKPHYVSYVGEFLADLFGIERAEFAQQMERNFDALFKERA